MNSHGKYSSVFIENGKAPYASEASKDSRVRGIRNEPSKNTKDFIQFTKLFNNEHESYQKSKKIKRKSINAGKGDPCIQALI